MASRSSTKSPAGRLPWLTFGLALVCVGVFAWQERSVRGLDAQVREGLREASAYFSEHPYLEPPPALATRMGDDAIEANRRRFEQAEIQRDAAPIPEGVIRRRQKKLDDRVAASLAPLGELPILDWGVDAQRKDPATLLGHVVFHSGWLHLLGNIGLLVILGFYLESAWGPVLYGLFLVGAAPVTSNTFALLSPEEQRLFVGTSALLAAALGAFAVRFRPLWRDGAWPLLLVTGAVWLLLPVRLGHEPSLFHPFGLVSNLDAAGGVSYPVYGVGFLFGAVAAAALRLLRLEEALVAVGRDARSTRASNPLLERAVEEQAAGHLKQAFALVAQNLEKNPHDSDAALVMWDVAGALGRPADAADAMLRVIREDVRRRDPESAVAHWLELEAAGLSAGADVSLLIRIATLLRLQQRPGAALEALRRALDQADGSTAVASRVAREARELDAQTAEQAAWRALGSAELDYQERRALEQMLGEIHRERSDARHLQRETHEPPVPVEKPGVEEDQRPSPIDLDVNARPFEVREVRPLGLTAGTLELETGDGAKRSLDLSRVEALAVAAVQGLGRKPVIVVDLVLNWMTPVDEPLRLLRMRGDRFDPRRLAPGESSPVEALRTALERLLRASDATPLPDAESVRGRPFASFESLAVYQRDVLMVDDPDADLR
jgi:membrane associated rhomboid family serine protease